MLILAAAAARSGGAFHAGQKRDHVSWRETESTPIDFECACACACERVRRAAFVVSNQQQKLFSAEFTFCPAVLLRSRLDHLAYVHAVPIYLQLCWARKTLIWSTGPRPGSSLFWFPGFEPFS